jgi:AcrR family transcriptional regulator
MPKEVDHDERREELLEAVWRVIARDGIERATMRSLATETGWSTGVLAHYFADKDDILGSALTLAYERIAARWDEKLAGLAPTDALHELVLDNLPLDDEREIETKFVMNYWSGLIRNGGVQRTPGGGPALIDRLVELARNGQEAGEITRDEPPEDVAERLLALIDGLSLHSLLDPQRLTRERQVSLVEQEFNRLRIPQPTSAIAGDGASTTRRRTTHA